MITEREMLMLERRKKGLKLKDLANIMGCSISLLSKYERGECNISDEKYRQYRELIFYAETP